MSYKIHPYVWPADWADLQAAFRDLLAAPFTDFYDALLSWASGVYKIDLIKFDELLHTRFGDYENRGYSMSDLIIREYGLDAANLLNALI